MYALIQASKNVKDIPYRIEGSVAKMMDDELRVRFRRASSVVSSSSNVKIRVACVIMPTLVSAQHKLDSSTDLLLFCCLLHQLDKVKYISSQSYIENHTYIVYHDWILSYSCFTRLRRKRCCICAINEHASYRQADSIANGTIWLLLEWRGERELKKARGGKESRRRRGSSTNDGA